MKTRSLLAALLALLVVAAGVPAIATAAPTSVLAGTIDWGFKESFRNYVPKAGQSADGGATKRPDGTFQWTVDGGSYDPATRELVVEGSGRAVFNFQGHTFVISIAEPTITLTGTEGLMAATLTVDIVDASTGALTSTSTERVDFARLDVLKGARTVGDGTLTWSGIPTTLTAAGAAAFAADIGGNGTLTHFYSAGTVLDPLSLSLTGDWAAEAVDPDDFTAPGVGAIAATGNLAPTLGAGLWTVSDRDRGIVYSVTGAGPTQEVWALDAVSGALLSPTPIMALGRTQSHSAPTLNPHTGDLVFIAGLGVAESGTSHAATALLTIPKTADGWGAPEFRPIDVYAPLSVPPVVDPTTGDVYIVSGNWYYPEGASTRTIGISGTFVRYTGASLATEGAASPAALLGVPRIVGQQVFRTTDTANPSATNIGVDWQTRRAYLYAGAYAGAPSSRLDAIELGTATPSVESVSFPQAGTARNGSTLAVSQADGSVFLPQQDENFHVIDGRTPGLTERGTIDLRGNYATTVVDEANGVLWVGAPGTTTTGNPVRAYDISSASVADWTEIGSTELYPGDAWTGHSLGLRADGALLATINSATVAPLPQGIRVVEVLEGPTITTQPAAVSVELEGATYQGDGSLGGETPETVTFTAAASGSPAPAVQWQARTAFGWSDLVDGDAVSGSTTGTLSISATAALDGTAYRAVFQNTVTDFAGATTTVGRLGTATAELTVTVAEPVPSDVGAGAIAQADGSVVGGANATGARTTVAPGVEVPVVDEGESLALSGSGFIEASNHSGAYGLFGYVTRFPSQGGSLGNGYDYIPGGGDAGLDGQVYVAWPGGDSSVATASFAGGAFAATGLTARSTFTGESGGQVDCFAEHIQCGVFTIGAHGGVDAALETFTPVFFVGQEVTIDTAPAVPAAPGTTSPVVQGSLTWGVRASFRSYVTGPIAKGSISVAQGAKSSSGRFVLPQTAAADLASGTGTVPYTGAVRFSGHGGILDLTLSNPSIRVTSASAATLYLSVNGGPAVAFGSVNLGAATRSDVAGAISYAGAPVTLTAQGAAAFSYQGNAFYGAGEAMDPIGFTVGSAGAGFAGGSSTAAAFASTTWTPPATPPATEGIVVDGDLVDGGEITASAGGFQPDETDIKVVVYSDPIVLATDVAADANGDVNWTGFLPAGLTGEHTLTFQGSVSRGVVIDIAPASTELSGCVVSGATLDWGFKESFRSYISGSIAHGQWEVSNGAAYETPRFGWADGSGSFDAEAFSGLVAFTGTIRFTGHDGVLDTTIENPQLRIIDETRAELLLDVSGPTMEGDPIDVSATPFVSIDLSAATVETGDDGAITVTDAPTAITAQGYTAFPNYQEGTEFDAISFSIPAPADCAVVAAAPPVDAAVTPIAETQSLTWLIWAGAAVLLAGLIAFVIALLVRRRRAA